MKGQVIKSTGSWYVVRDEETHQFYRARLRGKFKLNNIKVTNPLAVGDYVDYELEDENEENYIITKILDRHNYVIRKATKLSAQAQIIASNIDQAYLITTLKSPQTSAGFIDRFLVTTESFRIPVTIFFNKTDLLNDKDIDKLADRMALYDELGYKCVPISLENTEDFEAIKEDLIGKNTLLSGHSGVGKSTFINKLIPEMDLATKAISKYNDKGQHTTTFAEMHLLPISGKIIDTPGIKEIGIVDLDNEEIGHYFVEIRERIGQCKFHNCLHVNEPGCAVKEAVELGDIASSRYNTYLSLLDI